MTKGALYKPIRQDINIIGVHSTIHFNQIGLGIITYTCIIMVIHIIIIQHVHVLYIGCVWVQVAGPSSCLSLSTSSVRSRISGEDIEALRDARLHDGHQLVRGDHYQDARPWQEAVLR